MAGAVFDFNGTMFFDEKFQEISWRTFIGQKVKRDITDEEFQKYIHGRNADGYTDINICLSKTGVGEN